MTTRYMKFSTVLLMITTIPYALSFAVKMYGREDDHVVPTYFRKVDDTGHLVDRQNPEYDKALQHPIEIIDDTSGATLKITPSVASNGGEIVISWSGIGNPHDKDIIAFYCPYNDNSTHYLDYIEVKDVEGWRSGSGNVSVTVYNMRSACAFRYYSVQTISRLIAVSNLLTFNNGGNSAPLQGHIALTGNPTEMKIIWVSGKVTEQPSVWYGERSVLNHVETQVEVKTYSAQDMCEQPANSNGFWHPGYIYIVLLRNLKPNTKYFYQYGTETHKSNIYHFLTMIPAGYQIPYKFIVYGDMGIDPYPQGFSTSNNVYNDIVDTGKNDTIEPSYRFVFHNGDISYALGYGYIWDQWFSIIEPYATLVPYMVGVGNHEQDHRAGGKKDPSGAPGESSYSPIWGNYGSDSNGECGVPMYKRFSMPANGNGIWWYSYNYGLVHFVMMSTEHDFSPGSRQYKWLEQDLNQVNHTLTPWVVLGGHRAMYCSEIQPWDYVVSINMQRLFEDLLFHYKVDIAIWAHYHLYERTCKLYKGKCISNGVMHITVGSAGRKKDPNVFFKKNWSVYRRDEYGYGRVLVANTTSLLWEWVENRSHKVLDSVWLHKS